MRGSHRGRAPVPGPGRPRDGPHPRRGRSRRGQAAHAAVQEAINAGVYVSAGGLENQPASIVATDGAVTDVPYPEAIGGFTLVDVPSREEALQWAAKIAVACRCAQEVREVGADPELDAMLRRADSRR
jgi:hypothetical protein